jgi:PAS domain S-box-containing protein
MAKDLSDHQQLEEALRESEERYRCLVDLSPDLIGIHVEGQLAFINTAGAKLLGATSPQQIIGRPLSDFWPPSQRGVADQVQRMLEKPASPIEQKWLRLDGTNVYLEVTAVPFTYRNQPAIQIIAQDITARKRLEAALHESEDRHRRLMELYLDSIGVETARTAELQAALRRAQEVDRLKSQLLSTVSHELRTPLTSIRGQTTTLLDYADQISPEEQLEALRIVDEEAARLDELISHLLDMSRLEAGTLRVEPVATDLRPILLEAVARMATHAPTHTLIADLPPALPLAQADPHRVMQVVSNLLDNAIKFSPPGTTVTLDAEVLSSNVVVNVRDQGPGIAPDHLPRIFERFYRVEDSSVRTSGVGLGLAICKGLVEAMHGHITVTSQVGHGSTFSFSLPRTQGMRDEQI